MKKVIIIALVVLFVASGCGILKQNTATSENIDLYFATKGYTGLNTEQRSIEYDNMKEKYTKALEEWVKGPSDVAKFEKSISDAVKVLGASIEGDNLTVDLSKEFNVFNGAMHEGATIAALVNTMTQFPEVNKVRITVEGQDLIAPSGSPYGFLSEIQFDPNAQNQLKPREVILYFSDDQAMNVVAEKRIIQIPENATKDVLIKALVEELITGTQNPELYAVIPAQAKVNTVAIMGERASIDFSDEMLTMHTGGAAGEDMTLTSIVNTVTEVEGIKEVVITVNGKPLNIEHVIVDSSNPLTRAEDRILTE